jgi:DNA sulfur modification protein DndD
MHCRRLKSKQIKSLIEVIEITFSFHFLFFARFGEKKSCKESLIKSIEVDRDTFELKLTNPDGAMIDNADLSAGERQILAYAVLWGLSKASGRPLPNLIDTPMGRLDKTHKMNIALNYFHQASHQVIILSTDSEIYGEFLDSMQPGIGHMYSLEFDENTKSTKVIEGYFR